MGIKGICSYCGKRFTVSANQFKEFQRTKHRELESRGNSNKSQPDLDTNGTLEEFEGSIDSIYPIGDFLPTCNACKLNVCDDQTAFEQMSSYFPYFPRYRKGHYYLKDQKGLIRLDNTINTLNSGCNDCIGRIEEERGKNFELYLILRPLIDLSNEILHDGKKFVPINENLKHYPEIGSIVPEEFIRVLKNPIHEGDMPMSHYSKFIEWHFDIFGLIEKGLAIDLNTEDKIELELAESHSKWLGKS